jgi:sugar phosphate isomerase/epimerase
MWKQKIGISIGNAYAIPTTEVVKMVARTGFEAISPAWKQGIDLTDVIDTARDCGLAIQSIHGPFHGAAALWSEDAAVSGPAIAELLEALEDCRKFRIPVMVMHTWIGFEYSQVPNETGLRNYGILVATAKEYGVRIAFENTEGEEFLFALMDHFQNDDTVGFCWDSGHEMCYSYGKDLLKLLGHRLIMTHLNDNLGVSRFDGKTYWTDDLHLLPYDGIGDWDTLIQRLQKSRKLEYLNFELNITSKPNRHENDVYAQMPLEQYFAEAYKRACRIAHRYAQ